MKSKREKENKIATNTLQTGRTVTRLKWIYMFVPLWMWEAHKVKHFESCTEPGFHKHRRCYCWNALLTAQLIDLHEHSSSMHEYKWLRYSGGVCMFGFSWKRCEYKSKDKHADLNTKAYNNDNLFVKDFD